MAKGDRANLERLLRHAWEMQRRNQTASPPKPSAKIDWRDLALAGLAFLIEAMALLYGVSILTLAAAALFWFALRGYRREQRASRTLVFDAGSALVLVLLTTVIPLGTKTYLDRRHSIKRAPQKTIAVMEPSVNVIDAEYPTGTLLGGINWSSRFTDLRIFFFNSTSVEYRDLDFTLVPDQPVAAAGQITNLPEVFFSPTDNPFLDYEVIPSGIRKRIVNPLVLIASTQGYRMRCGLLPREERLEIVLAVASVIDFPKPGQKPTIPHDGVFDRSYVLKTNDSFWWGHVKDVHGNLIEEVYKPQRVIPKTIKITGHYKIGEEEKEVTTQIEAKDFVGDALKKSLK